MEVPEQQTRLVFICGFLASCSKIGFPLDVDIDNRQGSILHWACENNMPNTVGVLLQRETVTQGINQADRSGRTALCIAAEAGASPAVADSSGRTPVQVAA